MPAQSHNRLSCQPLQNGFIARVKMSMQEIMLCCLKIAGPGVLLALMTATPGSGQTASNLGKQQPQAPSRIPWAVICSNAQSGILSCQMEQTLVSAKTRQRLLSAVLFPRPQDGKMVMLLSLPHGIWLPFGVVLGIDGRGATDRIPVEHGDANGSYVNVPVDAALLGKMKRGSKLTVSMKTRQEKIFHLELSLDRFSASFDSMRSATVSVPG